MVESNDRRWGEWGFGGGSSRTRSAILMETLSGTGRGKDTGNKTEKGPMGSWEDGRALWEIRHSEGERTSPRRGLK